MNDKIDKSKYKQVDYNPVGPIVNGYIQRLNEQAGVMPAEEMAGILASTIAAVAYVMSQSNDAETIKHLFNLLVDDAHKQFERRKILVEKMEKKPTILRIN